MSERIKIAALREWFAADGSGVERIWAHEVLALVEAVEAAHTLIEALPAHGPHGLYGKALMAADDALAKFDFEGAA